MSATAIRRKRRPLLAATVALAAGLVTLATPSAHASYDWHCGQNLAPGDYCPPGPNHSLRQSRAYHVSGSTSLVGAGAWDANWNPYGSLVYDTDGKVCHSYGGGNVLYPVVQNSSGTYSQVINGLSYWGSAEPACPPDNQLRAAAAKASAATELTSRWKTSDLRAVQVDQAASFSVFRQARRAGDRLSAAQAALVGNAARPGIRRLFRSVQSTTGEAWVSPGDGYVCLSVPDPADGYGVVCGETERVAEQGLVLLMMDPASPTVVQATALVPDGASVTVLGDDHAPTPLEVDADGVASAEVAQADEIEITTAEGTRTVPMPAIPQPLARSAR